jgi:hypothetical protein
VSLVVVHPRCEEITKSYPTQKLCRNTIGGCVDYLTAAILSRLDMLAERSFAKWHVDNLTMASATATISASDGIFAARPFWI